MPTIGQDNNGKSAAQGTNHLGAGSWAVLIVLISLLAATFVVAYLGWDSAKDANVPTSAYVAMAFGVVISLAVGFGLMALLFYSSRQGYDEPPMIVDMGETSGGDGTDATNDQDRPGQLPGQSR